MVSVVSVALLIAMLVLGSGVVDSIVSLGLIVLMLLVVEQFNSYPARRMLVTLLVVLG